MIEPNELRIGNALFDRNNDIVIVESIHDYGINYDPDIEACKYQFRDNELRPIPLTEERLLKCGFKKTSKHILSNNWGVRYYTSFKEVKVLSIRRKIDSIHQLQNLYFALDGKELEINNYAL